MDFKFGTQLGFTKAHHKTTPSGPVLYDLPNILWFPFNICATAEASNFKFGMQLGLAKAHHEDHTQRKSWPGIGLGKLPYIWNSPLIFLQWPRCRLSVSGASCLLKFLH